jgi:CRP-like cAMP-binding protein
MDLNTLSSAAHRMVRASRWAHELNDEQLLRVVPAIVERRVPAGGYVCRKGEAVEHWTGIVDGLVKLANTSREGRSATFAGFPSGVWFGEGSILKRQPRRYDAIALRDTVVACLPRAVFEWLCETSLAFNRFLVHQLNERCWQFVEMLENERLLDRDARVAHNLWMLLNAQVYPNRDLHIEISQAEIGNLSGLSRQHVNKALHVLEREGLLHVDYGGVTIRDPAALENYGRMTVGVDARG